MTPRRYPLPAPVWYALSVVWLVAFVGLAVCACLGWLTPAPI